MSDEITARGAAELLRAEGIVPEAYRDCVGVWTWGVGLTESSGIKPAAYRDRPQTIGRCIESYLQVLRARYLPAVIDVLGPGLPEHVLAAALSFHWNTGQIRTASWPKLYRAGRMAEARASFLSWNKPSAVVSRRKAEAALLFDGKWSGDGTTLVYDVAKPAYTPTNPRRVPIASALQQILGGR